MGNSLAQLELDPAMLEIARARAAAQLLPDGLSHEDGTGGLVFASLLANQGLDYTLAGENLARFLGADSSLSERIEQMWMNSPLHRQNILEPSFNRLAIEVATDAAGHVMFAALFRAAP